jgi:hypothetical protein
MGTILANTILENASRLLQDEGYDRHSKAELTIYFDECQRDIVVKSPKSNIVVAAWQLVAGVVQSVPESGIEFIRLYCNMGANGTLQGASINQVNNDVFDRTCPNWTTRTASATVKCYMYDPQNPSKFLVYPQQPTSGMGYVKGAYSALVNDVSKTGDVPASNAVINLPDYFAPAMEYYIASRALSKDNDDLNNMQLASMYLQQYLMLLSSKGKAEDIYNPNLNFKTQGMQ